MDTNTAKLKKNAFRVTRERGLTASRVRVPGGHLEAKYLGVLQHIAEEYGNGTVHITSRQGFEIPGIPFDKIDEVNAALQGIIEGLEINQETENEGYPAAGTRNITACIGNRVCPYACYDTTAFAKGIEKAVFPNDLHFKIALTGCPNDCGKVRMHDFGIMGMTEPQLDPTRCISCGACVKKCEKKSVGAPTMQNYRTIRDAQKCIGCGECVIKIILNTYDYVKEYIDPNAPGGKEHIGYIVDRTGFEEFKRWALKDVVLPEKAEVMSPMYWKGIKY